jgi:hypothetical protein
MSKRSRGQMMVQSLKAQSGSAVVSSPPTEKAKAEIKSPLKKLMESPAGRKVMEAESASATAEEVSRLSSKFKTVNSVVTTLRNRRKPCTWDSIVESYQTISPESLSMDDLTTILTIWKDAFAVRWQVKTFDAQQNPRSYELVVELPPASASLPTSPTKTATTVSSSSSMDVPAESSNTQVSAVSAISERIFAFK